MTQKNKIGVYIMRQNKKKITFEHFILYVSFVTNCQRGRLLGSKRLEQLANREHKLV